LASGGNLLLGALSVVVSFGIAEKSLSSQLEKKTMHRYPVGEILPFPNGNVVWYRVLQFCVRGPLVVDLQQAMRCFRAEACDEIGEWHPSRAFLEGGMINRDHGLKVGPRH
jgi:hypothetical protein